MAEMSMNRVIHGAVRRDLDRFTNALSALDGGDERRVEQVSAAWPTSTSSSPVTTQASTASPGRRCARPASAMT
jgi:hypothetical protein